MHSRVLCLAFVAISAPLYSQVIGGSFPQGSTVTCSYPLPLGSDTVAAAFSFRRLRAAYSGKSVKLRRASDSTTLDIGFRDCDFDTTAAAAFCVATTCSIATWYDQSGNVANVTQATTADQPAYTASCLGGKPCATLAGTVQVLTGTLSSGVSADTFAGVGSYVSITGTAYMGFAGTTVNGTGVGYSTSSTACASIRFVSSTAFKGTQTCSLSTAYRVGASQTNTFSRAFISGTAGTDNASSTTLASLTALTVGGAGSITAIMNGTINEVILFAPDISNADYGTVSSNQATYWGVA